ncbi:hypothetical protein QTP86_000182 [Hemibagrus guttatus]|nr:hypothetical protein QTP86_000182 [Hemibagrus guttatus]
MDLRGENDDDNVDCERPAPIEVFASRSTLHGIAHMFTYERLCVRRCLWIIFFAGSLSFLVFVCADRVRFYLQYPHVTKLDEISTPLMTFPAVTFCNLNSFRFSRVTRNDLYHAGELLALLNGSLIYNKYLRSTVQSNGECGKEANLPGEYQDYQDVFSQMAATKLPPHRPWDCAIDLLPGAKLPKGRVYPLLIPETKAMEEYISEALQQGFIGPFTSPVASSFFFVAKKDGGLRPCIVYHVLNSQTVLNRLCHYHLYLKLEKCEFHQSTTQFLGYVLSPKGIQVYCTKVEAIKSWPQPSTVKDLQHFLGFANFYHQFISGYSDLTAPLTSLLCKKPKNLSWTSGAIEAFQKLKAAFCMTPTLVHADPTRPFIVEVDASTLGMGAVLSQRRGETPLLHPCAYFSKKLSPLEQNYDIGNREPLAIKLALEEWRHWL